jgi:hypothetical protein
MNSTGKILCSKCKEFYGTEAFQGFCSVCFKIEGKKTEQIEKKENIIQENTEEKKEEIVVAETKVESKLIQDKKDQCWKCQKKVGYLGFACKCGYVFCGVHRHFNEHNCDFDYKTVERERLKKDNPLIAAKKV